MQDGELSETRSRGGECALLGIVWLCGGEEDEARKKKKGKARQRRESGTT